MKLTICITTYNRRASLLRALCSITNQVNVEYEVIIVDDASSETVSENELSSAGCNLRVVSHKSNQGLAAARNTAISLACGEYFSFCDDDDEWPSTLASRLVSTMDNAPADVSMAIALSDKYKLAFSDLFETYPHLITLMKAGFTPPVGSQIYRTALLRQIGGYRPDVLSGVDHDLWISLSRIDPRVGVAWGLPAIVGISPSRVRMTTIEYRRRLCIEKSLSVWREDLCHVFGLQFYHHFVKSYRRYLDYNFFIKSIQKREYLDSVLRAARSPWLLIQLFTRRWNSLRGRTRITAFPKFKCR